MAVSLGFGASAWQAGPEMGSRRMLQSLHLTLLVYPPG